MRQRAIGLYHLGLMYSESISGVPYELSLIKGGVGINDLQKTTRLITFLHETSHFIHDLSLGVCLNRDFLLDEAAAYLLPLVASLSQKRRLVFPLNNGSVMADMDYNEKKAINFAAEREYLAKSPFDQSISIDTSWLSLDSQSGLEAQTELSGIHLLEGIVVLKTLFALVGRRMGDHELSYLQESSSDLPLLPENLDQVYHLALRLFDARVGLTLTGTNPRFLRSWPTDLLGIDNTGRRLVDVSFLYIADIALHIPPMETITDLVSTGQNSLDDFQPVHRFLTAISIIEKEAYIPPSDASGVKGFYRLLFNWLAEKAGWPSYEVTYVAWEAKLLWLRSERGAMSDGYRFRVWVERHVNSTGVLMYDPTLICGTQFVPLIHLTPTGLKQIWPFMWQTKEGNINGLIPTFEVSTIPVWSLMNYKAERWENIPRDLLNNPQNGNIGLIYNIEMSRSLSFLQEIVMRSMCRVVQSAILYDEYLVCPWSSRGCDIVQPQCKRIYDFDSIPQEGCSLRKYILLQGIDPNNITWKAPKE